ncbi:GID complex subunit containing RING finger motif [Peltigera leucophlebia]|nr:GID complex subunit containing RING finger motif [Peltigera leucophlebia]
MTELTSTKLNAESHLLLDQPLLRLPHELARKKFKTVQKHVEHERDVVLSSLKSTANAAFVEQDSVQTLASLDTMISRMQGLKRKMETIHAEEKILHQHSRKRLQHLQDLYEIPSLADVKYDEWSRVRLNRLLVDYLLRSGYGESASALAREKGIEELVDLDVFVQCHKIKESLRGRNTQECLAWCVENRPMMKKISSNLEFQLRLQQYVELCRNRQLLEAMQYAQKYLASHVELWAVVQAAGLLAYPPETQTEPYKGLYSESRWNDLARLFIRTHHELFSIPAQPLLHIALSAGLSALKTPSCHSKNASSSANASSSTTSVCPICSTELNELARNMPYAHHPKSYVENDPVVLPNGRVYGHERLKQTSLKYGLDPAKYVKDPTTAEVFDASKIRKVYIL